MTWPRGKLLPHHLHTKLSPRKTATWSTEQRHPCSAIGALTQAAAAPLGDTAEETDQQESVPEKASLITESRSRWICSVVDTLEMCPPGHVVQNKCSHVQKRRPCLSGRTAARTWLPTRRVRMTFVPQSLSLPSSLSSPLYSGCWKLGGVTKLRDNQGTWTCNLRQGPGSSL